MKILLVLAIATTNFLAVRCLINKFAKAFDDSQEPDNFHSD